MLIGVCNAGPVQLQAECAASAPGVPHPGLPWQVLLPQDVHHEQACLCCHTDPLSFEASPRLCLIPAPGTASQGLYILAGNDNEE